MSETGFSEAIEVLSDRMAGCDKCVVFTGAGISTESGIPDFRGPGGIWTKYDPRDFTYQKFLASEENRRKRWIMFRETTSLFKAKPNAAHIAVSELERLGKLHCVITQNVDNLHQSAGNSKVIELHGNALWVKCLDCGARFPRDEIQRRLEEGEEIPECHICNGMLKSATVSFGEPMPEKETREAFERSENCDFFMVVGSSLAVQPAASMPVYAKRAGATLAIINLTETSLDEIADIIIRAPATEVLPPAVKRIEEKLRVDN